MTALRPHPIHAPSLFVLLGLLCPLITKGQKVRSRTVHEDGSCDIKNVRVWSSSPIDLFDASKSSVKQRAKTILDSNQLAAINKTLPIKHKAGKGHRAYSNDELSIVRNKVLDLLKKGIFDRKIQYATILNEEENFDSRYLPVNEHGEKMAFATFQVYASAARDYFDNPIPSQREQAIIDAYKSGKRFEELAKLFNTSNYIVKYTLKKFGIANRAKWPALSYRKTIIEMAAAGKTAKEIMREVNCDSSSVYRVLNQEKNRNGKFM